MHACLLAKKFPKLFISEMKFLRAISEHVKVSATRSAVAGQGDSDTNLFLLQLSTDLFGFFFSPRLFADAKPTHGQPFLGLSGVAADFAASASTEQLKC